MPAFARTMPAVVILSVARRDRLRPKPAATFYPSTSSACPRLRPYSIRQQHDTFVIPSWNSFDFECATEAVLFSFSDRIVQEKLDFFREQRINA